ncbi:MAG: hypothetical protein WBI14_04385 [Anaerolineaceae bacterium]
MKTSLCIRKEPIYGLAQGPTPTLVRAGTRAGVKASPYDRKHPPIGFEAACGHPALGFEGLKGEEFIAVVFVLFAAQGDLIRQDLVGRNPLPLRTPPLLLI